MAIQPEAAPTQPPKPEEKPKYIVTITGNGTVLGPEEAKELKKDR